MRRIRLIAIFVLLASWPGASQTDDDRKRISEFQDRMRRGEPGKPARESTGLAPLNDLGKHSYKGEQGGLYPGGSNSAPSSHLNAGMRIGTEIKPLDSEGRYSPDGKIVMVSIGMSNTTIESQTFAARLKKESGINPKFLFVDCAQGGQVAIVTARPQSPYWKVAAERLAAAGVTAAQVQVVWLKQANAAPMGGFVDEAKKLQGDLARNVRTLHDKYPNLKLIYLSSRIYAGFAAVPLNPEPYAYESGFAVKWVIADQIAGDPELNYDPAKGVVKAPWLGWGPYLWADGNRPRSDGLTYNRTDVVADGTHPAPSAREKVASLLLNFLQRDPTSRPWFAGKQIRYGYGPMDWVEPDKTPVEGTEYKTFRSKTLNADVNYSVYLPPDYEQQNSVRYPVLYELPASGQTTKGGAEIVRRVDQGVRAGRISPMIVILVNGLRGNTMYCDSRDGRYPPETVIVKDLVPHVDATYRTIASREGRGLDGFSMGGFGAAHLGFKFPELFGVLSIMAPPLLGPELKQPRPTQAWSRLFSTAMAGDMEYFRANDPFTLVEKNADKLRDRTVIRIVAHMEEEQWLWPQCEKLHKLMAQHMVQHEFFFLTNVKSHNRTQCLNTMGDSAVAFFSSSLVRR